MVSRTISLLLLFLLFERRYESYDADVDLKYLIFIWSRELNPVEAMRGLFFFYVIPIFYIMVGMQMMSTDGHAKMISIRLVTVSGRNLKSIKVECDTTVDKLVSDLRAQYKADGDVAPVVKLVFGDRCLSGPGIGDNMRVPIGDLGITNGSALTVVFEKPPPTCAWCDPEGKDVDNDGDVSGSDWPGKRLSCCSNLSGGDRTCRHHGARNIVADLANAAGMRPEVEKPGLFPPAPDSLNTNLRRPADVYLPSWQNGRPAALDLAITSPHRQDMRQAAPLAPGAAAQAYESTKRSHLHTAVDCEQQGFAFVPVVGEPSGGWGPSAMCVLTSLAHAAAVRSGQTEGAVLRTYLQRLCTSVRKARAMHVLLFLICRSYKKARLMMNPCSI